MKRAPDDASPTKTRQRTELTPAQRGILTKLGIDPPKKIIGLVTPATP